MKLTYLSVSTLFLAASACSTADDNSGAITTDTTSNVSTFPSDSTSGAAASSAPVNSTGVNPSTSNVGPSTDTMRSDSTSTVPTAVSPTTTATTTLPPFTTDSQGSGLSSTTQDSTRTNSQPDSSSDTSQETDGSDSTEPDADVVDTGADDKFSFFVTSYHHMAALSGSPDGFGGDFRYKGAKTGLEGADAICQEIARRVGFGHRTWRAYLSTSTVNAIDRVGTGPWYDFVGALVADSPSALTSGANRLPGGCCEKGTYDELGLFHDGKTDQNNDGIDDDDHDVITGSRTDGTYAGFSCDDWTSTTASSGEGGGQMGGGQMGGGQMGGGFGGGFGGLGGGVQFGHAWPAQSGQHWATAHAGHQCAAGTNFVQDGFGDSSTIGGGGGYGGIYCFALAE